jgi:hypothetical protein
LFDLNKLAHRNELTFLHDFYAYADVKVNTTIEEGFAGEVMAA